MDLVDTSVKAVSTQPGESRSSKGCWTCRLRRKKCDERRPGCSRCASVSLVCQYGSKPDWFGDEELSKHELNRIKALVKSSAAKRRNASVEAKDSRTLSSMHHPQSAQRVDSRASSIAISNGGGPLHTPSSVGEVGLDSNYPVKTCLWPQAIEHQEANLMMHYLDIVFYIQFRFYLPSVEHGGRGWLLSLLTNTKPLYHAALSLSAFHQRSLLSYDHHAAYRFDGTLDELKHHHQLSLKELRIFIQANSENGSSNEVFEGNIRILACMVELISFELFNDGGSNWQMHLLAACNLVQTLHQTSYASSLAPALDFLTGAIIWFDILSCVSTSSLPHLSGHYSRLLGDDDRLMLDRIMGCQNWVMFIISEVAELAARGSGPGQTTCIVTHSMLNAKESLQQRIIYGKTTLSSQITAVNREYNGPPPVTNKEANEHYLILLITNIFANAALVYLHTSTASIYPAIDVASAVKTTIAAFKLLPDPRMTRSLVWPLCVVGSTARTKEDQRYFSEISRAAIGDARAFGNSGKALEVLEKAWEMSDNGLIDVDCTASIRELQSSVLLV